MHLDFVNFTFVETTIENLIVLIRTGCALKTDQVGFKIPIQILVNLLIVNFREINSINFEIPINFRHFGHINNFVNILMAKAVN